MSVLLETSLGDLVIDLDTERCPTICENFLKLCKLYKYNYLTFFSVQKGFLAQTGDPSNSGNGGQCVWSLLEESSPQYSPSRSFRPEKLDDGRHSKRGTVSMACRKDAKGDLTAASQFFVTLGDDLDYLDDKHAPFGRVVEGDEKGGTLDQINTAFVDKDMRPMRDIRIQHVVVLDDPFQDPIGFLVPSRTPSPTPEQLAAVSLDASAAIEDERDRPVEERDEERRKRDTNAAALTLEMVGDLPFAEVRPPENILFVCKLNPVTQSEDLELIFSRFGKILSCEVIRDKRTGDSLQYAFIEFDERDSAEQAYFKMQNVLVDDRRIWVDFSQSVSKLSSSWNANRTEGKRLKITAGPRSTSYSGHKERTDDRYRHDRSPPRPYDRRDDRRRHDTYERRSEQRSRSHYSSHDRRDREDGSDYRRDTYTSHANGGERSHRRERSPDRRRGDYR